MTTVSRPRLIRNSQTLVADQTGYRQLKATGVGSFCAYKSVDQTNVPNSTWTKVTFGAEEFDVSNWYDTSTSRFTPRQPGFYRLSAMIFASDAGSNQEVQVAIYKNGSIYKTGVAGLSGGGVGGAKVNVSVTAKADGDDYFEVYFWHEVAGDTTDINAPSSIEHNFFEGEFIALQGS